MMAPVHRGFTIGDPCMMDTGGTQLYTPRPDEIALLFA
jgi:hypothetical protein